MEEKAQSIQKKTLTVLADLILRVVSSFRCVYNHLPWRPGQREGIARYIWL